ncbi:MAG: DUF3298 and DUF4163 domain-containing protein [Firmicutes bacterium]|nr:DUF3298 and DUF4163 domain-containing protein [Bacillota bacterium]
MKKLLYIIAFVLFLISDNYLAIASKLNSKSDYQIIPHTLKISNKEILFKISYPQIKNLENKDSQENFNKTIRVYVYTQMNVLKKEVRDTKVYINKHKLPQAELRFPHAIVQNFETKFHNKYLISIVLAGSIYTGGAHPNSLHYILAFDLKKGKEVKLENLFKHGMNYLEVISRYCTDQLLKRNFGDKNWTKEGASAKKENYKYFYITSSGLGIIFWRGQVASMADGVQEVFIPYNQINDIIDSNGPLSSILK